MKTNSIYSYHAFLSILFAAFLISCSSSTPPPSSGHKERPISSQNHPSIPEEIQSLLASGTCMGCHKMDKKLIGPSYLEIAKRGYSEEQIVALIKNPVPKNWPDYPPMAPITWLANEDLTTIATWISSLSKDQQD